MNVNSNFQHFEYLTIRDYFKDNIDWNTLLENTNAIHILETELDDNLYKLKNLDGLFENPNAVHLFEKYKNYINYSRLQNNKNVEVFKILEKNVDKITDWMQLSRRTEPEAIAFLKKNLDKVDWGYLSENPAAIHILENNLDRVDWIALSENPAAIHILEDNLDRVDWGYLSENTAAIHILKKNLDKVNWEALCCNPAAIDIIEENIEGLVNHWDFIVHNPNAGHLITNNNLNFILDGQLDFAYKNAGFLKFLENNLNLVNWGAIILFMSNIGSYQEKLNDKDISNIVKFAKKYKNIVPFPNDISCIRFWETAQLFPDFIDDIIEKKIDICNYNASINPGIFTYNYKKIKAIDINEYFYHPSFYSQYLEKYNEFVNEDHYLNWFLFKR